MVVNSGFSVLHCLVMLSFVLCMVINVHTSMIHAFRTVPVLVHVCTGMYRHLQARLRSNAESVAFYGGIEKEGKIVVARFKELLRHHSRLLTKQWQFGMVQVAPAPLLPCAPSTYLHRLAAPLSSLVYGEFACRPFLFAVCLRCRHSFFYHSSSIKALACVKSDMSVM